MKSSPLSRPPQCDFNALGTNGQRREGKVGGQVEYSVRLGSGKVSKALKVCLPMKKKYGFGKPDLDRKGNGESPRVPVKGTARRAPFAALIFNSIEDCSKREASLPSPLAPSVWLCHLLSYESADPRFQSLDSTDTQALHIRFTRKRLLLYERDSLEEEDV